MGRTATEDRGAWLWAALFAGTIFLSAFLLFQVQPLIGRDDAVAFEGAPLGGQAVGDQDDVAGLLAASDELARREGLSGLEEKALRKAVNREAQDQP